MARKLLNLRVPFYLPLIQRKTLVRGRPLTSHLPLFTSYLFLHGDHEAKVAALSTSHVVQAIAVNDQARLWNDLRQLHRMIATGMPITAEDKLGPGMPVEIRSGPLAGLKGKILRSASGRRFIVEIDFVHKGASVLLDDFVLAKGD